VTRIITTGLLIVVYFLDFFRFLSIFVGVFTLTQEGNVLALPQAEIH